MIFFFFLHVIENNYLLEFVLMFRTRDCYTLMRHNVQPKMEHCSLVYFQQRNNKKLNKQLRNKYLAVSVLFLDCLSKSELYPLLVSISSTLHFPFGSPFSSNRL